MTAGPRRKRGGRPKQSSEVPLSGTRQLDRQSSVPLYYQLGEVLKEKLEAETWPPGARFATERELEEVFGVSRAVVRRAFELLVADGAIERIKGSGTFVAQPKRQLPVTGMVHALIHRQEELTILDARERPPDPTVARFLEIDRRPLPVAHLTAVIRADEPVCFIDSYSPAELVPWMLPTAHALQAGTSPPSPGAVELTRATVWVEGSFFGRWGASQLNVNAGDPALVGRLVQFGRTPGSKKERPLEFARLVYRSDNAQLAIDRE